MQVELRFSARRPKRCRFRPRIALQSSENTLQTSSRPSSPKEDVNHWKRSYRPLEFHQVDWDNARLATIITHTRDNILLFEQYLLLIFNKIITCKERLIGVSVCLIVRFKSLSFKFEGYRPAIEGCFNALWMGEKWQRIRVLHTWCGVLWKC